MEMKRRWLQGGSEGREGKEKQKWKGVKRKKNKLSESLQKNEDIQVQIPTVHARRQGLRILYGST